MYIDVCREVALNLQTVVVIVDATPAGLAQSAPLTRCGSTMYPRTVRIRSTNGTVNEYVCIVEAYREDGKVKQRVVADFGRKDVLLAILPKLQRLPERKIEPDDDTSVELKVINAST